jgi:hypothetical protein
VIMAEEDLSWEVITPCFQVRAVDDTGGEHDGCRRLSETTRQMPPTSLRRPPGCLSFNEIASGSMRQDTRRVTRLPSALLECR